ncbi:MAG TPA: hypothetical protein VKP11_09815, partial [Frankiaceae bacterium]|nr:hypothetical protein [Frankiaceae bacterium]
MSAEAADQAVEALRLVDGQPAHAWSLACEAARRADAERDHGATAVAERARGLAALHLAHLDTAVRHLRVAVAAAGRARSPHLVGEARMSLAFVLNRRGEPRRALRVVDAALADLAGVARARALAQRGAILQQLGRLDEALAGYRAALPVLRVAGDDVWVQRVLSNRAVLNVYRSNLPAAESDLLEAEELCRRGALELQLAFVHENLGFVHTRRGDVPAALHHLDEAERRYQALHVPFGSVLVDRSELLLSVRLVGEGRDAAERATGEFTRLRRRIHLPEAQLLLATAALLDDDPHGALRAARQAARTLAAQNRPEWLALARFTMVKSRLLLPDPPRVRLGQLVAVAEALATTGWAATALDARLLVARVALERHRPAQARAQLGRAAAARRRGPAEVRAGAWQAEAMLRLLDGRRGGAVRAVRAGLRVLDEHRATLGATDLRAHVSGHRTQLAELGLRIALTGGRPHQVLAWAERGRASHLLQRPVRPPQDRVLAHALAELRATIAALEEDGRSRQQA